MTASPVYPSRFVYADLNNDGICEADISAYITSNIDIESGTFSDKDTDLLAGIGTARFELRNDGGYVTATALEGKLIDVKVSYAGIEQLVWSGRIQPQTKIDSGGYGDQKADVAAADWFAVAYGTQVENLPLSQSKRSDEAAQILFALAPDPPEHLDMDAGTESFVSVFDSASKNTVVYSELDRIVKSELGRAYLRYRDGTRETLRFENRLARGSTHLLSRIPENIASPAILIYSDGTNSGNLIYSDGTNSGNLKYYSDTPAVIDRTMIVSDWRRGDGLVNKMTVTRYPRRVDTSDVVLWTMNERMYLGASSKFNVGGNWNRTDGGNLIQASSWNTPVVGTDIKITQNSDGTGTDYSSELSVWSWYWNPSISGFVATFRNQSPGWFWMQVTGRGIYKDNNVDYTNSNSESQTDIVHTVKAESLSRDYSSDVNTCKSFADHVVAMRRAPNTEMKTASFIANYNEASLMAFLFLDVGDKVQITESVPSHTGDYYIQGIKASLSLGGIIAYTWYLKEDIKTLCTPFAGVGSHDFGVDAIDFGVLSHIANMTGFSYSFWYRRDQSTDGGYILSHAVDLGSGRRGNLVYAESGLISFTSYKTPTDGTWITSTPIPVDNAYHHVCVTYDNTTDTADPTIYINGIEYADTESGTPSGASDSDADCPLILFNDSKDPAEPVMEYLSDVGDLSAKDFRIYNRILSPAEVAELAAAEDDYTTVPDGLVFSGIYAPTGNIADYIGDTIGDDDLVLETVYGIAGIPYHYIAPGGAEDPMLSGEVI